MHIVLERVAIAPRLFGGCQRRTQGYGCGCRMRVGSPIRTADN